METDIDAKPENLNVNNSSISGQGDASNQIKIDREYLNNDYYDMSGQNYMIILNHSTYKKTVYFNFKTPPKREGTAFDVKALQNVFGKTLGFKMLVLNDLDYEDIKVNLKEFCNQDHSTTTCVSVAIMTHGEQDGTLYAADRPYLLTDVINIFDNVNSLLLKPKLFFVQACRGDEIDSGKRIHLDGRQKVYKLPSRADFLILYSTMEGFVAFRDQYGSWLIQALCYMVQEHYQTLDLLHIVTLVNREVALGRISTNYKIPEIHDKKAMPETCFSLTKLLKFE